jgi:hypothetical protein
MEEKKPIRITIIRRWERSQPHYRPFFIGMSTPGLFFGIHNFSKKPVCPALNFDSGQKSPISETNKLKFLC